MDFRAQPDAPPFLHADDWRSLMLPDSRHRMVNKITETLKKHFVFSGQEGLHELKQAAVMFEESWYNAATSQTDYLREISLKMLALEANNLNAIPQLSINTPASTSIYLFGSESNNWRPAQQDPVPNDTDTVDWRSWLQPDSRHRIINKIFETLKKQVPFDSEEGFLELRRVADRFETRIYNSATSQTEYLRKISLKMLTIQAGPQF